jgi:hypothetical protein
MNIVIVELGILRSRGINQNEDNDYHRVATRGVLVPHTKRKQLPSRI